MQKSKSKLNKLSRFLTFELSYFRALSLSYFRAFLLSSSLALSLSRSLAFSLSSFFKRERGFTLIEAMVAIFILAVGVTGAITLISSSIVGFSVSKERLVATNLAQEGIEVIHNIRDNNWLNSDNVATPPAWNDWTGDGAGDSCTPCGGNVLWNSVNFTNGSGLDLKWNSTDNRYNLSGAGNSYYRVITISDNPDSDDATPDVSVKSTIGWGGGTGSCTANNITVPYKYCLTLEERLYNWK